MTKQNSSPFSILPMAYRRALRRAVREALAEDIGSGDVTTTSLKLSGRRGRAVLIAKEDGTLAGTDAFALCFHFLDRNIRIAWENSAGQRIRSGARVAVLTGDAAAILTAERSALNFLSHLSGIATCAADMVARIPKGTARLLDTRKTTPGLRLLEKRAAALGGAVNHRLALDDAFMIKDNHIAAAGGIDSALRPIMPARGRRRLICEVTGMRQIAVALDSGVNWLLLDNFPPQQLSHAVHVIRHWQKEHDRTVIVEASGGVTPRRIGRIARTGVDYISSGYMTHSAPALDFSLEWSGPAASRRSRARHSR